MGVVNLDEAGLLQVVGIDDAAVVLVMLAPQQDIDLIDEVFQVIRAGGGFDWNAKQLRATGNDRAEQYVYSQFRKGWEA